MAVRYLQFRPRMAIVFVFAASPRAVQRQTSTSLRINSASNLDALIIQSLHRLETELEFFLDSTLKLGHKKSEPKANFHVGPSRIEVIEVDFLRGA